MKRLTFAILLLLLSVSVMAITYPSRPYQRIYDVQASQPAVLYMSSDAMMHSMSVNKNCMKSVSMTSWFGVGTMTIYSSAGMHSVGGSGLLFSAPVQMATTTFDGKLPTYRADGPPSTGGEDPENPDLWVPIGDGIGWILLLLALYTCLKIFKKQDSTISL